MIRTFSLAVCLLVISAGHLSATDPHLTNDPASSLYKSSSWAHGYIHGYEWGFHFGNRDLHMAARARDARKLKEYKEAAKAFHQEDGNKQDFEKGYQSGFEVGYSDGILGESFRAAESARKFVSESPATPGASRDFDSGMQMGYGMGRTIGARDGRADLDFSDGHDCPINRPQSQCSGFKLGYRWGYLDGYNNQRRPDAQQREARR